MLVLPLLRSIQITIIAMIITSKAATTGTTKFKLERMIRIVSSAVSSGISRVGAIVPETTNQKEKKKERLNGGDCINSLVLFLEACARLTV